MYGCASSLVNLFPFSFWNLPTYFSLFYVYCSLMLVLKGMHSPMVISFAWRAPSNHHIKIVRGCCFVNIYIKCNRALMIVHLQFDYWVFLSFYLHFYSFTMSLNNANDNLIYGITNGSLFDSLNTIDFKKVKIQKLVSSWVEPMYGAQPNIIFYPKKWSLKNSLLKYMVFATRSIT